MFRPRIICLGNLYYIYENLFLKFSIFSINLLNNLYNIYSKKPHKYIYYNYN